MCLCSCKSHPYALSRCCVCIFFFCSIFGAAKCKYFLYSFALFCPSFDKWIQDFGNVSTGKAARIPEATATQYVKNYTHREKYQEMIRKMEQKTAIRNGSLWNHHKKPICKHETGHAKFLRKITGKLEQYHTSTWLMLKKQKPYPNTVTNTYTTNDRAIERRHISPACWFAFGCANAFLAWINQNRWTPHKRMQINDKSSKSTNAVFKHMKPNPPLHWEKKIRKKWENKKQREN